MQKVCFLSYLNVKLVKVQLIYYQYKRFLCNYLIIYYHIIKKIFDILTNLKVTYLLIYD